MEPIFALTIVFGSLLLFMKMMFDYRRSKLLSGTSEGTSLGASELKRLIREAVEEGVRPVVDRLDTLEGRLDTREILMLDEPLAETPADESDG